jgi:hypothetical protein
MDIYFSHYISIISILKLVNLAMADIVKQIGKRSLATLSASPNIPPSLIIVLASIQCQRAGEDHMQRLTNDAWVQLRVDVEDEGCLRVVGCCADAGDAVVFGVVDGGDGEVLVEELGVARHAGHFGWRVSRQVRDRDWADKNVMIARDSSGKE